MFALWGWGTVNVLHIEPRTIGRLYFHGAKAGHKIDGLRPVIMKLEATDEESKIACEQQ